MLPSSNPTNPAGQSPSRIFLIAAIVLGIGYWGWHTYQKNVFREIYQATAPVATLSAEIDENGDAAIYDEFDTLVTTIEAPSGYSAIPGFTTVSISPYERYVLVGIDQEDNTTKGWIYDLRTEEVYDVPHPMSNIELFQWLGDGKLEYYEGCETLAYCKQYQSTSPTEPWEVELVEDFGI